MAEAAPPPATLRVAIIGNPNTGKTTLFNRLCGLRHKTGNFPGTTQEARVAWRPAPSRLAEADQKARRVCRRPAAGPSVGHSLRARPHPRGEVLRRRLPPSSPST
jgi:hypothetical protein